VAHVRSVRSPDIEALWRRHGPFVDYVLGAQPDAEFHDRAMRASVPAGHDGVLQDGEGASLPLLPPYHLCHVEAMECVAEAALDGRSLLEPTRGSGRTCSPTPSATCGRGEVGRDRRLHVLRDDRRLRGRGSHPGLPICLAEDVALTRDVRKDEPILMDGVAHDPSRYEFDLFGRALRASSWA